MKRSLVLYENRICADGWLVWFVFVFGVLLLALALATAAAAGTAYISLVGDFASAGDQHDFYVDLTRPVSSAEVLRFETFANGVGTNAAGDSFLGGGIDSVLELFDSAALQRGYDDDGSFTAGFDSLLSWPGVAQFDDVPLNPDPLLAGNYRLNLSEFGNDALGQWALDLLGPEDAIVFRSDSPIGTSSISTLTAGNGAQVSFGGTYELDGGKNFTFQSGADFSVTGYLDIGNTTNGFLTVKNPGSTLTTNTSSTTYLDWGQGGGRAYVVIADGATADIRAIYINMAADNNDFSSGYVLVESGADLTVNSLNVGTGAGIGEIDVTGNGSTIVQNGGSSVTIGSPGGLDATLAVVDQASFTSGTGPITVDPSGRILVNDATLTANGTLTVGATFVGFGGVILENQGQINSHDVFVGANAASGLVVINGYAPIGQPATWEVAGSMRIGSAGLGSGSAIVEQGGRLNVSNDLTVRGSVDATGTLTVQTNGEITVGDVLTVGTQGAIELLGSSITARSFIVEQYGTFTHEDGTLTVDGGIFDPGDTMYTLDGASSTDLPVVKLINGATASISTTGGAVFVGDDYRGRLEILTGSQVDLPDANSVLGIGQEVGSEGEVIIEGPGSQLTTQWGLIVGQEGNGVLRILGGGSVFDPDSPGEPIAYFSGSVGLVEVAGTAAGGTPSTWTTNGIVHVGMEGHGTMTISAGGLVNALVGATIGVYSSANGSGATVTGFDPISGSSRWDVTGSLYVGGHSGASGGTGTLTVSDNGQVIAGNIKVWQPGTVELDNGIINTGNFELAGGTLRGKGEVLLSAGGSLHNAGLVSPGFSPGVIAVNGGNYVQDAAGTLVIEIGGISPSEYDRLDIVSGTATLAGTLDVSFINLGSGLFAPSADDTFEILTAAGGLGETTFDNIFFPDLGGGLVFGVFYNPTNVTLAVGGVLGDYNLNGFVDAADYTVWRNTLHQSGSGLAADGNRNGSIDAGDYGVWKSHYGQMAGSGSGAMAGTPGRANAAIPEPATLPLLMLAAALWYLRRRRTA